MTQASWRSRDAMIAADYGVGRHPCACLSLGPVGPADRLIPGLWPCTQTTFRERSDLAFLANG